MREIKFRAWDTENNEMCQIDAVFLDDGDVEGRRPSGGAAVLEKGEYTLMQYTGLKDRNGVEIYEGDIFDNGRVKGVVVWDNNGYWTVNVINDKKWVPEHYRLVTYGDNYEVIGNIHENPELLK